MTLKFVGKPVIRADAREKVTGNALYIDDLYFPRMLFMKVKRSGIPHGNIIKVDTSEAELVEGVYKVLSRNTPELAEEIIIGTCIHDLSPIAIDKVRHEGDIVAVVIAESEKTANTAISKIRVDIEELLHVQDPIEAATPGAPLIHEKNGDYKHLPTFTPVPGTNVFFKYHLKKGEHQDVFKDADVTVEEEFSYPLVNHAAIEPHGTIVRWNHGGDLHVWSSSQAPFILREVLAEMFDLQMNKIHVHVPLLGGGFGGKSDYTIEPIVALAARFLPGYHVKFVLTREEVFTGSVLGRGMKGRMKIGVKDDGIFCGLESELFFSDGASGDTGCNVVLAAGHNCAGPYFWPNCNIVSNGVYTNTPPVGAFRGYGHPEGQFMMERLVEKLAKKIGISSIDIRKKNFLKPGNTNSLNQEISRHNGDILQCFNKMVEILESNQLPEEDSDFLYGRGVAAIVKSPVQASNASSCVFLKFNEDLSVNVSIGGVEMGQGCLTVLAQIAAEKLMIPVGKIRINHEINSQITPYEWQTVASMTTMRVGNAIIEACEKSIMIFKENAALAAGCSVDKCTYDGENVSCGSITFALHQLVKGFQHEDGHAVGKPVMATGSSVVRNVTHPDPNTGQYKPYEWTFGAQGCDIKINKKSGKITVLHFVTVLDVGKVINPDTARGQILGGVMQGIGQALQEEIIFDISGKISNATLRKYKVPKFSDMPEKYSCVFLENPQPNGPYGARPLAEHPVIGPPPAILNALEKATGISINSLPATPAKVLEMMERRDS